MSERRKNEKKTNEREFTYFSYAKQDESKRNGTIVSANRAKRKKKKKATRNFVAEKILYENSIKYYFIISY